MFDIPGGSKLAMLFIFSPSGLSFLLFKSLAIARSLNFFVFGDSRPPRACPSCIWTPERWSQGFFFMLASEVSLAGIYSSLIINFLSGILEGKVFESSLEIWMLLLVKCLVGPLNLFSSESFKEFLRFGEEIFITGFGTIEGLSGRILSFLGEMYDSKP